MIERFPIDPIRDRATWLAFRAADITASDVPAVCGEGLFGSPASVWAEKKGLIPTKERTEAMKRGLWGEAAVFSAIADEYPEWEVRAAKVYLRDPDLRLGATPDGAAIIPGREGVVIVQAKVIAAPIFKANWIDDDSDDVVHGSFTPPLAYQLQTLTEMMLAGASAGVLAVLVVDTFKWTLRTFWVEPNPKVAAVICTKVGMFWRMYLDANIQPPIDPERDEALVKTLFPRDNMDEIDLSSDNELPGLADALIAARADKKDAEGREKSAKTAIAAKMGEAADAHIAGGRIITFRSQVRKGYVVNPTEFRVMKVVGA